MFQLIVIEGPNRGSIFPLTSGDNRLGRDASCEVVVLDEQVSRTHAVLRVSDHGCEFEEGNSRNGTYLNGTRCDGAILRSGDILRLGRVTLMFIDLDDSSSPSLPELVPGGATWGGKMNSVGEMASVAGSTRYLLGESSAIRKVERLVFRAARTDVTVLVTGESGTGKELVASSVHRNSRRRSMPFVALNGAVLRGSLLESELFGHEKGAFTGALARRQGSFEMADGGTLFLDEVGELPLETQASLLRILEGKGFRRLGGTSMIAPDVRLVAATNRNLLEMVSQGHFREDLYYRLAVVHIDLPPLRDRDEDVVLLARHFLEEISQEVGVRIQGFGESAVESLRRYPFPGNVRELRNLVERAVLFSDGERIEHLEMGPGSYSESLESSGLPSVSGHSSAPFLSIEELVQQHIREALSRAEGNKSQAARLLGIDRATLYARMKKHGIEG